MLIKNQDEEKPAEAGTEEVKKETPETPAEPSGEEEETE